MHESIRQQPLGPQKVAQQVTLESVLLAAPMLLPTQEV